MKSKIIKTTVATKEAPVQIKTTIISKVAPVIINIIKSISNFTEKYVYNVVSKKTLLLYYYFSRITLKFLVITNILTAIIIYFAKILEVEVLFTWDLIFVLLLGIFIFCRDIIFDLSAKMLTYFKNIFEHIIDYLNEVKINSDKENVEKYKDHIKKQMIKYKDQSNNIATPAKEAYATLAESGKLDDIQPKAESGYVTYKTLIIITCIVTTLGLLYLGWVNYEQLSPFLKKTFDVVTFLPIKIFVDLPAKAYQGIKKVLNIFISSKNKGNSLPSTDPTNKVPIEIPPIPNDTGIFSPITNWWKTYKRNKALFESWDLTDNELVRLEESRKQSEFEFQTLINNLNNARIAKGRKSD